MSVEQFEKDYPHLPKTVSMLEFIMLATANTALSDIVDKLVWDSHASPSTLLEILIAKELSNRAINDKLPSDMDGFNVNKYLNNSTESVE